MNEKTQSDERCGDDSFFDAPFTLLCKRALLSSHDSLRSSEMAPPAAATLLSAEIFNRCQTQYPEIVRLPGFLGYVHEALTALYSEFRPRISSTENATDYATNFARALWQRCMDADWDEKLRAQTADAPPSMTEAVAAPDTTDKTSEAIVPNTATAQKRPMIAGADS